MARVVVVMVAFACISVQCVASDFMYRISINGYTSFEFEVPMSDWNGSTRITISRTTKGECMCIDDAFLFKVDLNTIDSAKNNSPHGVTGFTELKSALVAGFQGG